MDTIQDAVLIPSAAIQHSPTETFVYVVGADNAVKVRPVTQGPALSAVGPDEADLTVVTGGVQPGDVVVTDGVDKLTDGTKVTPRQAEDRHHGGGTTQPTTAPAAEGAAGAAPTTRPAGGRRGGRRPTE